MVWKKDIRDPSTAPLDGSMFYGIPKYGIVAELMCWDAEMVCFLTRDFGCHNRIAGWWPAPKNEPSPESETSPPRP
jgi:hypothetical protein